MKICFIPFVSLLFSSCALLLNNESQKISIEVPDKDVAVLVDGKKIEPESFHKIKVKRESKVHTINVAKNGFENQKIAIMPLKLSFPAKISVLLIAPYIFGDAYTEKVYQYPKKSVIAPFVKINHDSIDELKDLVVEKVKFKSYSSDLKVIKYRKFIKNKNKVRKSQSFGHGALLNESTQNILKDILNLHLHETGFVDSDYSIKNTVNHLELEVELIDEQINLIEKKYAFFYSYSSFLYLNTTFKWIVKDHKGIEIYSENIEVQSNHEIINSGNSYSKPIKEGMYETPYLNALQDCFQKSINRFLSSKKVNSFRAIENLKEIKTKKEELKKIVLTQKNKTENLNDFHKCMVKIKINDNPHSGFFIGDEGQIITVLDAANLKDSIEVIVNGELTFKAKLLHWEEGSNLAVLKINHPATLVMSLADFYECKLTENVFALGISSYESNTMTLSKGIVSGKRNFNGLPQIQISSKLNPGYLGGALVSESGKLYGILNFKMNGSSIEGLGFASPVSLLHELIEIK